MSTLSAVAQDPSLLEFLSDPTLTVACVLLIVVSLAWVVVSRLIVRRIRRAARRASPG